MDFTQVEKEFIRNKVLPDFDWARFDNPTQPFPLQKPVTQCRVALVVTAGACVHGPGPASSWSERHAAYAAGLGTFSLNDALITRKGMAHRLGSLLTDCPLSATPRDFADYRSNCLRFSNGGCGVCIARCPVGALSNQGHDKHKRRAYVYGTVPDMVAIRYGVKATGCGLCQTKVPCEFQIPASHQPFVACQR